VHQHLEQQAALLHTDPLTHVWLLLEFVCVASQQPEVHVHVCAQNHVQNQLANLRKTAARQCGVAEV
jgi:hypothetical protein